MIKKRTQFNKRLKEIGELSGVTVDLSRDLNGNGELDPGEPKIGSGIFESAVEMWNL